MTTNGKIPEAKSARKATIAGQKKKSTMRDACKRMNPARQSDAPRYRGMIQPTSDHLDLNKAGSKKDRNLFGYSKYDDGPLHSKSLHKEACKECQSKWFNSIEKRRFDSTEIADFEALLGRGNTYADHMPASDPFLRNKMGAFLIHESQVLLSRCQSDPSLKLFFVTFVGDKFMLNEHDGTAEVFKLRRAIQSAIRNYTSFDAIGIIENQPIVNYPKARPGKTMSLHAHVLCWGPEDETSSLKKRAKGFESAITTVPIHSERVHLREGSLSRLARYMAKPPSSGKEVNFEQLANGKRCLYPARRLELYHHLRLFEYSAKVPLASTLFGVGKGNDVKNRILKEMDQWQRHRPGVERKIGDRVYRLFEAMLKDNVRLKRYQPLVVNCTKDGPLKFDVIE